MWASRTSARNSRCLLDPYPKITCGSLSTYQTPVQSPSHYWPGACKGEIVPRKKLPLQTPGRHIPLTKKHFPLARPLNLAFNQESQIPVPERPCRSVAQEHREPLALQLLLLMAPFSSFYQGKMTPWLPSWLPPAPEKPRRFGSWSVCQAGR